MTSFRTLASRNRLGALANTMIVAGGYLLSRVLGLGREVIISNQFGTTTALDAFRATFGVIDLIYIIIAGGALGSAFIPVFAGMLGEDDNERAWRLASSVLNLALVGLVGACVAVAVLAGPIVALTVGRGFSQETQELTVFLLRLMILQPLLLGLGGLAKAALESFDQFAIPALGSNLYNLGIIAGALVSPWFGIYGLVIGVNVGALLLLLIQLPALRQLGARYWRSAWLLTPGLAQVGRLIGPRLFGQAIWQINLIAIASFASLAGSGAVAANGYAIQLMLLPHGLLALSVATVIFPQLSRLHAAGEQKLFREVSVGALRGVLFFAIPAAAILGALAGPLVRMLFERGAFDAASTLLTASALERYAIGLVGFAAAEILVRTFYALQDTRTPVIIGGIAVLVNITLGYLTLRLGGGLPELATCFSIANTLEAALLFVALSRRAEAFSAGLWAALGRMLISGTACLALVLALRVDSAAWLPSVDPAGPYRWPGDFLLLAIWLVLAAGLGGALYLGMAAVLRIPELRPLLARLKRGR